MRDSDRFFSLSGYQGYVQAALVLGGVDCTGPHLHTVSFLLLAELSETMMILRTI